MPYELALVALFGSMKAWFEYLCTPEGQKLAAQMNAAGADFNAKMGELFNLLHTQVTTLTKK